MIYASLKGFSDLIGNQSHPACLDRVHVIIPFGIYINPYDRLFVTKSYQIMTKPSQCVSVCVLGAEEGQRYIEKTVSKHSEMVASIRELSDGLMELEAKLKVSQHKHT